MLQQNQQNVSQDSSHSDEIEVIVSSLNSEQVGEQINSVMIKESNDDDEISQSQILDLAGKSNVDEFRAEQMAEVNLQRAWAQAKVNKGHFFIENGLLYHHDQIFGQPVQQLCLPQKDIAEICHMAHDTYHQRFKRTNERIRAHFYWSGIRKFIKNYVNQCHECQMKAGAVVKDRVPISVMPRDPVRLHIYTCILSVHFLTVVNIGIVCV